MNDVCSEREDMFGWLEFGCWVAVALIPFLRWVNGPAVSTDQAMVRTALVVLALGGGIVLRTVNWRRGARSDRSRITCERNEEQWRSTQTDQ